MLLIFAPHKNTDACMGVLIKKWPKYTATLLAFTLLTMAAVAQTEGHTRRVHDSAVEQIKNDTIVPFLINKVRAYTVTIDKNTSYLKRKIKLTNVSADLPGIEAALKRFKERLAKQTNPWNLRGLNSAVILLKQTSFKLTGYQTNLNTYSKQLTQNNTDVKTIINDPILDIHIPDTALDMQLHDIHDEVFDLDTLQERALGQVNLMRNRTSVALLQCNDILSDLIYETAEFKRAMWGQEEEPLLIAKPHDYHKNLGIITEEALQRSGRIIMIYIAGKGFPIALCMAFFLFTLAWSFLNMRRIKKMESAPDILAQVLFFKRSIIVTALFGLFMYSPFFLANPTMSYLHLTELLRLFALAFLLTPFLSRQRRIYGAILFVLWLYYAADDILLESAFGERWGLFIAGLVLIAVCIKLLGLKGKYFRGIDESPAAKGLIIFTMVQVILSVIANLLGRTSLAKIFGVSAIQCLVLGVALKIFCAIVLEAIYLQSEAYGESRFSEFLNFNKLQHRFKRGLWILAVTLWVVSLIRNVTLYDAFTAFMVSFFSQQRSIGSLAFSFSSVAVFFFVIFISTVISRFVNFFFGNDASKNTVKRSSLGSMLLLIRLAIWAIGFLIAIAASGIPLDRLSIMIGALSVGIGFGLQNIVNNLVSGIIIAFEQPIKMGDQIEIGNKSGVVKEIGVRSSTIRSGDGANIIIPNGDLLSQHLINWTMQNRNKRVEFTISLPYDENIPNVKTLINDALDKSENVLHTTPPVIMVQAFNEKTVDVRIIFWVPDLTTAGTLRSNTMIEVYDSLKAAGVALPGFPKP